MAKNKLEDFKESVSETVAKDILLEELEEQGHLVMVEDVIFWALEFYVQNYDKGKATSGKAVAYTIVERIKEQEQITLDKNRWSRE
ncbi:MAG: hypothetical protein LBE34_12720 [Flavobacteriaceae bacterium]|jgi:hypothetical protein|nr:hypothetical protein [Flavobacteriaceae bacterium]